MQIQIITVTVEDPLLLRVHCRNSKDKDCLFTLIFKSLKLQQCKDKHNNYSKAESDHGNKKETQRMCLREETISGEKIICN